MRVILFVSLFGAIYSYAIYPLLLLLLPRRRPAVGSAVLTQQNVPVSLIIACRNESARLREKILNSLQIDYKPMEIIVASDASDDGSDNIVHAFSEKGVKLIRAPVRRGKEHAQGLATSSATGEILVFSDTGTTLQRDSISRMVAAFSDPAVGAVSSEDQLIGSDGKLVGEGAYVRYEMFLRRLESSVNGLVGLSGSFFAIRREVADNWDDSIPSDFACALSARSRDLYAVADPSVVGVYKDIADPTREYSRKVRTAVRGMTAISRRKEVLNPFRFGLFAFQIWSHKIMRWMVPWFLLVTFFANILLAVRGELLALAAIQVLAYGIVLACHILPSLRNNSILRLPYFFIQVNLALAQAAVQFVAGRRIVVWDPSVR